MVWIILMLLVAVIAGGVALFGRALRGSNDNDTASLGNWFM